LFARPIEPHQLAPGRVAGTKRDGAVPGNSHRDDGLCDLNWTSRQLQCGRIDPLREEVPVADVQ